MKFWPSIRAIGLLALPLFMSGCAMWPEAPMKRYFTYMLPSPRYARIESMNNFRAEGVFNIQCANAPHAWPFTQARFAWKNISNRQFEVRLESTINAYDINLIWEYRDVLVWRDFKYPFHIKHPEKYMTEGLGWSLPIKSLAYWIRGIPSPYAPFQAHYNQFGIIDFFNQQGWNITYKSFTAMDGYDVPRTMAIAGHGVYIRIVFNRWDTYFLNRSVSPL